MDTELLHLLYQAWIKVAEQINCPAPLPEEEEFPLLTKMLFPAPYDVPEKTAKKVAKGAKKGPCRKGAPDMSSEDETSSSSDDDDEEEEEENDSPPEVGRKKRAPPRIRRRKRLRGSKAPKRITPCGILIAVRSDLAGPSLGPLRKYHNPQSYGLPGLYY